MKWSIRRFFKHGRSVPRLTRDKTLWKKFLRFIKKAIKKRPARRKRASSRQGRRKTGVVRRVRRPAGPKRKKTSSRLKSSGKTSRKTARKAPKRSVKKPRKKIQVKSSSKSRPRRKTLKRPKSPSKKIVSKTIKEPKPTAVITHYFPKVRAAVLSVKKPLRIGDPIRIKGATTDFRQTIGSLQIDRKPITTGRPGQEVGLEVMRDVRPGDTVTVLKGKT